MKIKAYAKINLGLKVEDIRKDNLHNLKMIMVNINLFDIVHIRKCKSIKFDMSDNICPKEENIAYLVLWYIKQKYRINQGVSIYIEKNIPSGAGLGGGSADAAAVIKGLSELWNLCLSKPEMDKIAFMFGADVPFFLYNEISIVEGAGEIVMPIERDINYSVVLIVPGKKFSTANVYKFAKSSSVGDEKFYTLLNSYDIAPYIFNDLEKAVKELDNEFPLEEMKKNLIDAGCINSLMTGSGSTVYGLCDNKKINNIVKILEEKNPEYNIVKTEIVVKV
ncbi:MAG: 4-(cytidine 5'-diphospho)-2-C-methyl-D-erythritol kinase [Bacilli bacterium]